MNYALKVENLFYKYSKSLVLNNVSFEIQEATFFVLLGLNGAGKSTIFSLITRLLYNKKGSIFLNGFNLIDYKNALKSVGIVFQEPTLDMDLSVRQNLYYYGSLQGLSFNDTLKSIEKEIVNLELGDKLDTTVRDLNGGHRRRVEILRALVNEPKLLLLDEATVGLDVKARFDILAYIRNLIVRKKMSVLWITHLFDELHETDKIAIIKNGEITQEGIVSDFLKLNNNDNINDVFKSLVK